MILDADYQQQSIDEFQSLKNQIIGPLTTHFCGDASDCSFSITSFREGSVIVNFLVSIAVGASTNCAIVQSLLSQLNSIPPTIGGISVKPGSLSGKSEL